MTDVDPELFYQTANGYKVDSDVVAGALTTLTGALSTSDAAGTNGVGPSFATAFDGIADQVGELTSKLVNSFHNVGNVLQQSGINHDTTEQASTLNQRDSDGDPVTPAGLSEGTFLPGITDIASISGGSTPEPIGWDLVKDGVTDGWPNGDPAKLTAAATAWHTFGTTVQEVAFASPAEMTLVSTVESEEMPSATAKMNTTRNIAVTSATTGGDLSRAADEYAAALTQAQTFMTSTLLLLWLMHQAPKPRIPQLRIAQELALRVARITATWHCNNINASLRTTTETIIGEVGLKRVGSDLARGLTRVNELLGLTPRQVAPTSAERIRDNQRRGRIAEERAGIDPTTTKERIYPDPGNKKRYRIPDALDHDERVLTEVKNVDRLSMTQQIRDMATWATTQDDGPYSMVIVVDNRTDYSAVEAGLRRDFPNLKFEIRPMQLQ